MTRAQQTISIALLVSSVYLALYLRLVPLPAVVQTEIVPILPFWALVSFGAYLLVRLGWGVLTFNDYTVQDSTLETSPILHPLPLASVENGAQLMYKA
ncbi:hypothetical protein VP1G_10726 [Cytospora mali]|uniref:Dolichol-phosphate mannosyltransferase subunit 3 n=1 Tax=Cytospora mali TaxID=578113 RepID=A0A194UVP6_CYTMA|nr:hypothetical protein VP1G_10726 [Valsa mali var. pyri (nom. inval.)]